MWNGESEVMGLNPSDIRYTHDSISYRFTDGRKIGRVLDDIVEGRRSVDEIPPIRVSNYDGDWFSLDNRRLWVFKELNRLDMCDEVPVVELSDPHAVFTTQNDGACVKVRGCPGGHWHTQDYIPDDQREETCEDDSDWPSSEGQWENSGEESDSPSGDNYQEIGEYGNGQFYEQCKCLDDCSDTSSQCLCDEDEHFSARHDEYCYAEPHDYQGSGDYDEYCYAEPHDYQGSGDYDGYCYADPHYYHGSGDCDNDADCCGQDNDQQCGDSDSDDYF